MQASQGLERSGICLGLYGSFLDRFWIYYVDMFIKPSPLLTNLASERK